MATFSTVSLEEARRSVLPPRRAMQEAYRGYVRDLTRETAGQLELGEGDRPITERARLKAAAKDQGVNLEIRRRGNMMTFWLTDEPPRTRTKASAKPATRGGGRGRRKSG
jgi:hypothetical protein